MYALQLASQNHLLSWTGIIFWRRPDKAILFLQQLPKSLLQEPNGYGDIISSSVSKEKHGTLELYLSGLTLANLATNDEEGNLISYIT